jgi:hypothetical protein
MIELNLGRIRKLCVFLWATFVTKGDIRNFRATSFFGEEKKIFLLDFNNLLNNHSIILKIFFYVWSQCRIWFYHLSHVEITINQVDINKLNFIRKPWEIAHLDTLELWEIWRL